MSNILDFPKRASTNKALIEKSINAFLNRTTNDQKARHELTERLLSIFDLYQQDYSFDFSIDCPPTITQQEANIIQKSVKENFYRFEELIHDQMDRILLERFQAEINLYFLETTKNCMKGL